MLAEDSYEEQVARLVQGKRELFDNVISHEASEDVVGVSKRMLETIIEDLSEHRAPPRSMRPRPMWTVSQLPLRKSR